MAFTWENHRRCDGTLDLISALSEKAPHWIYTNTNLRRKAHEFLTDLEEIQPLRSYEAAAIALVHAINIVRDNT